MGIRSVCYLRMDKSRVKITDFSIDRILSDECNSCESNDVRVSEEWAGCGKGVSELHAWMRCTRYQPPKLPRSTSSRRRAGCHARIPFTAEQSVALESAFSRAHYLAPPALTALARALHLREDRIKIWFQNRRARERREKNVIIEQPRAIALPSNMKINIAKDCDVKSRQSSDSLSDDEEIVVDT